MHVERIVLSMTQSTSDISNIVQQSNYGDFWLEGREFGGHTEIQWTTGRGASNKARYKGRNGKRADEKRGEGEKLILR